MAVSEETAIYQNNGVFYNVMQYLAKLASYQYLYAAKLASTKSQFTSPQNASTYFGRALRKST